MLGRISTSREVCAVVIYYRACKVTVFPFSISIPSCSLDIKSFKNLGGQAAEIKGIEQLKLKGHITYGRLPEFKEQYNNVKQREKGTILEIT